MCEKVIGFENIVEISGADFDETTDFWKLISSKAGLTYEGQFASEKLISSTHDKYTKQETFSLTKDKIIEYYKNHNLVLVIDDFHYAPEGKRMQIAQQLKDAIRRGFKAIVVSLPHRADEAIRQNADLSGRLSLINMEPWAVGDLKEIAKLQELLYGREDIFKVLDWKEGSLYILDPLFLFYLRWGGGR